MSSLVIQAILLVVVLAGSFFFSSSETALFSLKAHHLDYLDPTDRRGARIRSLLAQPYHLLVLLLLGNNLVNIAAATVTNNLVVTGSKHFGLGSVGTALLSLFIGTGLLLVVGEIGAKTLALQMPMRLAGYASRPLMVLDRTLGPVVHIFFRLTQPVLKVLGLDQQTAAHVSEEELKTLVSVGEEEGVLEETEREMIGRVLHLENMLVREVFTPRPDMVRVPISATVGDVLAASVQYGHSRLPVVGDTVDDIRGICHVKDLIPCVREGQLGKPITEYMREVVYVPDTKTVDKCLREFRARRTHMAIVIDEYGGTAGLVTLEDLLEVIVGDIFDEHDDIENPFTQIVERRWDVDAATALTDLEEVWGPNVLPASEYDTLGGLVLELFQRFPKVGEAVEHDHTRFVVEAVQKNRLKRIRVEFSPEITAAGNGGSVVDKGKANGERT